MLHIATYRGFANVFKLCIDAGANVNAVDAQNMEPLFMQCKGPKMSPYLAVRMWTELDFIKCFPNGMVISNPQWDFTVTFYILLY